MDKVKVLLMGAAFSADLHMDAYARCADSAEVVAICDRDLARVAALAQRYGLVGVQVYDDCEQAIAEVDCDLVDICLPNFLHHRVAVAALRRGRQVICEKPLATTVTDGEALVATAKEVGQRGGIAQDGLLTGRGQDRPVHCRWPEKKHKCPNKNITIINEGILV